MAMTVREDVRIPSHGEELAAYVYRPDSVTGNVPCVVMAHGWSATRDDGLPGYAEAFRDAGFVVILFDYRHFGASTGEPRQLLDIRRQHDDYRAAVAWARRLDGVRAIQDTVQQPGPLFRGIPLRRLARYQEQLCPQATRVR